MSNNYDFNFRISSMNDSNFLDYLNQKALEYGVFKNSLWWHAYKQLFTSFPLSHLNLQRRVCVCVCVCVCVFGRGGYLAIES